MEIEVSINGRKIKTRTGLTILEAASQVGIKIPTLCYLKRLTPIGSCRVCSVEVKGISHPVPSCVALVKEGYEIYTDTDEIKEIRKNAISHLLLDHPLDCPVCDKSGDCLLQDLSFEFGLTAQKDKKIFPDRTMIFDSDYIEYMGTRCVLCSRCIRVCSDMYGDPFLEIKENGLLTYIGLTHDDGVQTGTMPEGSAFKEIKSETNNLDCYYCGNCIEVCPVGALITKKSKFKARYWQEVPFSSVCDKCSAACRIEFYRYPYEESIIRTAALFGGYLCREGFFYRETGVSPEYYINSPVIKKNSELKIVSKEEAISEFSGRIKNISGKGGMKNTAVLVSPTLSCNEGYAVSTFMKNILNPSYFDIAEPDIYRKNFNKFKELFDNSRDFDIKNLQKSDVILYIGSIEDEIPLVLYNIMKSHRQHGSKLLYARVDSANKPKPGLTRFEDISHIIQDIELSGVHDFLNNLRLGLYDCDYRAGVGHESRCLMSGKLLASNSVSIVIGDYIMSSYEIDKDFIIIKEIVEFLRDEKKNADVYPLIKPFNYRGLITSGINPGDGAALSSILSGLSSGEIKNLIFFGDFINDNTGKEIIKYLAGLEFVSVFSSKVSDISSMADIVVPITDYLEQKDALYENFEGKKVNVNNEFNIGDYDIDIISFLSSVAVETGYSFDYINDSLGKFKSSDNFKSVTKYNKIKPRSNFYYNDKTKLFY